MDLLVYLSYFFAFTVISLAVYFLYCWSKDQQLSDELSDDDQAGFDIDLINKSNDQDSNLT